MITTLHNNHTYSSSHRLQAVQAPIIPIVGELIQANPATVSLGQGIVHYPPPPEALNRLNEAMRDPARHRYDYVAGTSALLDRVKKKLVLDNGIDCRQGYEVMVTAGGNMAFQHAILAITDPGDEVILLTPYYFNHLMALQIANASPVLVATDAQFQIDLQAVRKAISPRTRAIVTVSPNNPTGTVYDESALRAINALCATHGLFHIHDEAYEYFTYEDTASFSPGAIDGAHEHTISLYSLSKSFGFAGWRIGYVVFPARLWSAMKKIQDTILICPPVPSQFAALGAMEAGVSYCKPYVKDLADVRHLVLKQLGLLGSKVTVPLPFGAFYAFAKVHTNVDSMTLVKKLVEQFQVAVIPGSTFGMTEGCYLRIAYGALKMETVKEAMDRLVSGIDYLVR